MIHHHPIQLSVLFDRQVDGFLSKREIGQVAGHESHLFRVLGLQGFEGRFAACDGDYVVRFWLAEEVVRDCEADAWVSVACQLLSLDRYGL